MSKQQILEREARIGPSVGIAGFAGAILFAGSLFLISGSSVGQADSVAAQLRAFNDDSVQFVLGQCLQALALLLLAYVIATLFRAAQVRSSNVLKGMLGLAAIGPALFATSIILTLFGFSAASSDFVDLPEPDVGGTAELTQLKDAIADDPGSIDKIRLLTDADVIEYQNEDGITSIAYPDDEEGDLESSAEDADIDFISDESGDAGELSAQEVVADNSLYNASRTLLLPASLALIAIVFYTARSAMRTGLQTQFWGTFGMAAGIATIILGPVGPFVWAVNAGLVSAGWGSQRRPPGWLAAEAMPWNAGKDDVSEPGDEESARPEDFEGSATEIAAERPGRRDNKRKRKRKAR